LPMAILIESSHLVPWRWPAGSREFNIASDLSGVVFFVVVVYIFSTEGAKGIFVILSIMPFILLLLLLLQLYSEQGRIKASALFISLRRLDPRTSPEAAAELDLSLPYVLLCLLSASSGNKEPLWFFLSVCLLIAVMLWPIRPSRYRPQIWLVLMITVFLLGYAGQTGIRDLQRSVELSLLGMFDHFMWRYRDPDRAATAIGSIGRLKFSDRITLRINPAREIDKPLLLREASYRKFNYGIWSNPDAEFTVIDPEITGNEWIFNNQEEPDNHAVISTYMVREAGVIPIPHGITRIQDVAAIEINRNQYGAVKMEIREGWISFRADFQSRYVAGEAPGTVDLSIADNYRDDFERLALELGLNNKSPREAVNTIKDFFVSNFYYSLVQTSRRPRGKYLHDFLYNTRSGHCEYFATATVLLLRAAGIPARYAAGYAVNEYSNLEGQYVARSRDAHSWALAYIDHGWQVVDTTPPVWMPIEDKESSIIQPVLDLFSWGRYRFFLFQTRNELEDETSNRYLLYLLVPLLAVLLWRLYLKRRVVHRSSDNATYRHPPDQGTDSSFYLLVKMLEKSGHVRSKGETLAAWLRRISKDTVGHDLAGALALHYRYRFDPEGDTPETRDELASRVRSVMEHN